MTISRAYMYIHINWKIDYSIPSTSNVSFNYHNRYYKMSKVFQDFTRSRKELRLSYYKRYYKFIALIFKIPTTFQKPRFRESNVTRRERSLEKFAKLSERRVFVESPAKRLLYRFGRPFVCNGSVMNRERRLGERATFPTFTTDWPDIDMLRD